MVCVTDMRGLREQFLKTKVQMIRSPPTWRTKWQTCFRETRRIVKCFTADYFLTLLSSLYCINFWRTKKLRWQREHQHRIHFHNLTVSESESPALANLIFETFSLQIMYMVVSSGFVHKKDWKNNNIINDDIINNNFIMIIIYKSDWNGGWKQFTLALRNS